MSKTQLGSEEGEVRSFILFFEELEDGKALTKKVIYSEEQT